MTSSLLHLPDGPRAQARDAKLARVWQDFAWIHGFDVQQSLGSSERPAAVASATQA